MSLSPNTHTMAQTSFWRGVHMVLQELPLEPVLFIVSLPDPMNPNVKAGHVSEAARELAAKCIATRSHKLADEADIRRFHDEQAARSREYAAIEANRPGSAGSVNSLGQAIANAFGQQVGAQNAKKGEKS